MASGAQRAAGNHHAVFKRVKVVLASASPRRKHLLESAGYKVETIVSGVEEVEDDSFLPGALALENARRKAEAVAFTCRESIVIAADTVVWKSGRFYGKPLDHADAAKILSALAGQTHEVVTGVVIVRPGEVQTEFAESSFVTFRALDSRAIEEYLKTINPLDKAGAYAAQDDNGRIIEKIEGSVSNVIGLPVERINELLGSA